MESNCSPKARFAAYDYKYSHGKMYYTLFYFNLIIYAILLRDMSCISAVELTFWTSKRYLACSICLTDVVQIFFILRWFYFISFFFIVLSWIFTEKYLNRVNVQRQLLSSFFDYAEGFFSLFLYIIHAIRYSNVAEYFSTFLSAISWYNFRL